MGAGPGFQIDKHISRNLSSFIFKILLGELKCMSICAMKNGSQAMITSNFESIYYI